MLSRVLTEKNAERTITEEIAATNQQQPQTTTVDLPHDDNIRSMQASSEDRDADQIYRVCPRSRTTTLRGQTH